MALPRLVRDFADGKPHQVNAFGTALVVFAGEDGKLNVLDAYCRHMGGNLAQGTVKGGNAIACPFHDWRWRGDGKCAEIPYARRVPPLARTRTWPVAEVSGQLFVWHDPRGGGKPPPVELAIPEVPTYGDSGWTDWVWNSIEVTGSHCREIVDNIVDMAHFFYVHYGMPTFFRNVFEGHTATQVMRSRPRADAVGVSQSTNYSVESQSDATYYGPSYMIDKLWSGGRDPESAPNIYLINCHYPITPTSFRLQYGVIVEKPVGGCPTTRPTRSPRPSPRASRSDSNRTSTSGRTNPGSTTRCSAKRTDPSTSSAVGTSSSTSMSTTSARRWSAVSSTRSIPSER